MSKVLCQSAAQARGVIVLIKVFSFFLGDARAEKTLLGWRLDPKHGDLQGKNGRVLLLPGQQRNLPCRLRMTPCPRAICGQK